MKSHLDYLLYLKTSKKENEIRDTWASLGSLVVTNKTKVYVKDTLFQVHLSDYTDPSIEPSQLANAIVYCSADYRVDNDEFPLINWDSVNVEEAEGKCSIISGITSPHFRVLLTRKEFNSITAILNEDYIPYKDSSQDSEIAISDDELEIILSETGVPFLRIEELEYNREKLLNICIKPALQEYYKYFPIIEQKELGQVGCNQQYLFELPAYCYAVKRAWVAQSGSGSSGGIAKGAYNFMMETAGSSGMGGSRFGRGVNYRGKNVPGYVGGTDYMSAYLMQRAAQQAMINYSKREKFNYTIIDKKRYITGFSSIGGMFCVHFAFWSPDWDYVRFDQLNNTRKLCTAYALQNLGMLRSLVKTDVPGNIDYSLYTNRAKELTDGVIDLWKTLPTNIAVVSRGEM